VDAEDEGVCSTDRNLERKARKGVFMLTLRTSAYLFLILALGLGRGTNLTAQSISRFGVEVESGPFWQSRNDVQIPNDETGTRFSLKDLVGGGPWTSVRFHLTWNLNDRHALRAILAPLSVTATGSLPEAVTFAGGQFATDQTVDGTYRFNSWRLGYRYRLTSRAGLNVWAGFTAKLRDAEVRLEQGETIAKDTDLGFVPLLHLAADWQFAPKTRLDFDFDGLAGGPGRAFDSALKITYELHNRVRIGVGYRTLEGGADVDSVYNFAWLHYGLLSVALFL
jgi:hypothetical protein